MPFGKLRVVGGTVGGGFGGKVDVMVEPIACIAAMATNRPVKFVYGRHEEMQVSSPRAAERIYIKDGVMADGTIVARKITLYVDAGAYSRHSPYGTTKAAAHMPGPYTIPNVWVDAHCVYTNRTPSSAMRGFGVTIGDFALESQMDRIARALDIDPLQLRLKNAYRDGDMKAHRKRAEGTALIEVIQRAAELVGHDLPGRATGRMSSTGGALMAKLRGRGYAAVNYPTGMNLGGDPSQALIHSTTTGTFVVTLSSVDLGQGIKTIAAQCAAETLGLPFENVLVDTADTDTGPHCMGTFASRGTHRVGNAVIMAAREAREVMLQVAADELEVDPDDLETDGTGFIKLKGSEEKKIHIVDLALAAHFKQGRTIAGRGIFLKEKSEPVPETGEMDPDSCQAHACTVAEVEVDDETGVVEVLAMSQRLRGRPRAQPRDGDAADRGRRLDGHLARAVRGDRALLPRARPRPDGLQRVPDARARPTTRAMESVILERPAANGPFGAKGIGEMTANAPIPAIANAIFDACGVRLETMPFTPERVLRGLDELAALMAARDRTSTRSRSSGGAFAEQRYFADEGLLTAVHLALVLGRPLALEGEPGVGQDRAGQGAGRRARPRADPAAVLRGARRRPGAVRVGLPQAAARRPRRRGRGPRGRRPLRRALPARAPAAARGARGRRRRAADRRDRPRGQRVRGVPARVPVATSRSRSRRSARCARRGRRWWC